MVGLEARTSTPGKCPSDLLASPAGVWDPVQTKAMDKRDIRDLKRWHLEAAIRARQAGFDIIYVYAAHWYLIRQFLLASNQRTDEYGGSVENRARLLKELIVETKEAVGDTCAVAVRFSASTGGPDHDQDTAEPREMIELLAELPRFVGHHGSRCQL